LEIPIDSLAGRVLSKKAALFSLVALLVFATIATNSRGGFLGLVAVGAYCWLLSAKKIVSGILVGLLIVLTVNFAPDTYVAKIRTIWEEGTEHETAGDRMYEWKIGWRMFLDHPIAGVGQNNFPWRFEEYEGTDKYLGKSRAGRAAHSLYFTLLPELGLMGTTIFLLILWSTVKDILLLRRSCRTTMGADASEDSQSQRVYATASAIGGGLVAYLVTSAFVSTLYYPCYWYTVGFSLALKNAYLSDIGADIPEYDPQLTAE